MIILDFRCSFSANPVETIDSIDCVETLETMESMDSYDTSLTQKRSHGSSDKEHPVLFRPLSQSKALLTRERGETYPFSLDISDLERRSILYALLFSNSTQVPSPYKRGFTLTSLHIGVLRFDIDSGITESEECYIQSRYLGENIIISLSFGTRLLAQSCT